MEGTKDFHKMGMAGEDSVGSVQEEDWDTGEEVAKAQAPFHLVGCS